VVATNSKDNFVDRAARDHLKSCSAMLLALSPLGITIDVCLDSFSSKGHWKDIEVHSSVNFSIDDATHFEWKLQALELMMDGFNNLEFQACRDQQSTLLLGS